MSKKTFMAAITISAFLISLLVGVQVDEVANPDRTSTAPPTGAPEYSQSPIPVEISQPTSSIVTFPSQQPDLTPTSLPIATPNSNQNTLPFQQNSSLKIESVIYNTTGNSLLDRIIDSNVSDVVVTNPGLGFETVTSVILYGPGAAPGYQVGEQVSKEISVIVTSNSTIDIPTLMSPTIGYPGALYYIVIRTSDGYTAISEPFPLMG